MSKRNFLWIFLCSGMLGSFAYGQKTISLEQARNLAIENNKSLKIADQKIRLAHYEKKEALANFFPKASFSATYLHFGTDLHLISRSAIPQGIPLPPSLGGGVLPISPEIQEGLYKAGEVDLGNLWLAGFSVTQPIFAGGKIVAYNDLRAYAEQLAKVMKETKMTDVIVEVDEAYWQTVSLVNKKKLAESYVSLLKKMDSDIEAMQTEGVATKADRLSVNVKLNEAEMTLTKATNGVSLSKMLLCQICGLEIEDGISLADESVDQISVDENKAILPNIEEVIHNRSEIRSLTLGTKIFEKKEKIAFSEFLPTAGLMLGYNWIKPNLSDGVENKFGGLFNVGLHVSVPLDFMSSSAKWNAAKTETTIQRLEVEEVKEKIILQINQSTYKVNEAYKKYITTQKNMQKADENLRYANAGFEEGVIPASDALAAHTAWLAAHSELIDSQIEVRLSNIYLNKALGQNLRSQTP